MTKLFQKGSTPKGKNLLLREQILFFKSRPSLRREANIKIAELLCLKMYHFTFNVEKLAAEVYLDTPALNCRCQMQQLFVSQNHYQMKLCMKN